MSYDLEGQFYVSQGMALPFFCELGKQGPIRRVLGTILEDLKTKIGTLLVLVI